MAVVDAPVCLTRSAPLDGCSGQLMFYDVVEFDAISRSEVLSCIVEAGGDVVLPDAVRLPEFKEWLTAVKAHKDDLNLMSFSSLCNVLKVADALGDAEMDGWIHLLAHRLGVHARPEQLQNDNSRDKIAESLSVLSDSVQLSIFAAAARQPRQVHDLLHFLPAHLHPAVVAASVTPTKLLEAPLHDHSLPFIRALLSLPPHPPSILSLDAHSHIEDPELQPMRGLTWQAVAPPLAEAVRHHSSISSLSLDVKCIESASAQLLASAIASLKALQSLHLHTSIDPDTARMLQQTLAALPQLQDLSLSLLHVSASQQQPPDASCAGETACGLSAMLSPATQLTSLTISAEADTDTDCFAAPSPLVLPYLSRLKASYGIPSFNSNTTSTPPPFHSTAAIQLVSHLAAPLTSLDLQLDQHHGYRLLPSDAPQAQRLFRSIQEFSQLKSLHIRTPEDTLVSGTAVLRAVTLAVPPALAALRDLEDLDISAPLGVLLASLPLLRAGAGNLSRLRLTCLNWQYARDDDFSEQWGQMLGALSSFPLGSLAVDLEDPVSDSVPGMAALLTDQLTQLTALRTDGWVCLRSGADLAALARMTALAKLQLISSSTPADLQRDCIRTLQQLPALTSLTVRSDQDIDFLPHELVAEEPPPGAWPSLQQLSMDLWDPDETELVFRLASARPALTWLAFDRQRIYEDMGAVDADVWERVMQRAADSGITLSFNWDFPF